METPITFEAPSYAIFDIAENAVRTTQWGNLAIFSTVAVANNILRQLPPGTCKIVPVWIKPTGQQH